MADIYAEVDMSKKKRVKATEPNTHKSANSSMYAMVDLNTSSRRASDEVDNSSTYDLIGIKNLYSTVNSVNSAEVSQKRAISHEPSIASTDNSRLHHHEQDKDRLPERNRNEGKLQLCMLTCLVILAIAVIAVFVGVISAFVLISTLKSDMESRGSEPGSLESRFNQLDNKITNFIKTSQMMLMELNESTSNRVNSLEGDITAASNLATDLPRLLNSTVEKNSALQEQLTIKIDDLSANVTNEAKIISDKADQVSRTTEGAVNSSAIQLATDIRALYVFESCDIVSGLTFPFPSGTYRIGSSQDNYSLMNCSTSTALTCNGTSGRWRRVAYLNTTSQTNIECPGCLKAATNPPSCRIFGKSPTCSSAFFSTGGLPYTQVCGRIYGRYSLTPDAFDTFPAGRSASPTIDDNYVDGVSLSYGMSPRNHVWTLAATVPQHSRMAGCTSCKYLVPDFVGSDYSCQRVPDCNRLSDDSTCRLVEVWNDDNQCNGGKTFYRNLAQTTTEDLEMRLCRDQAASDEDIFITFIEIFVSAP